VVVGGCAPSVLSCQVGQVGGMDESRAKKGSFDGPDGGGSIFRSALAWQVWVCRAEAPGRFQDAGAAQRWRSAADVPLLRLLLLLAATHPPTHQGRFVSGG